MNLKTNLQQVYQNIERTVAKSGRSAEQVKLIAVTKTVDVDIIQELFKFGVKDIGENRVQDAQKKYEELKAYDDVSWHMIGRLQKNKVKYVVKFCDMIHSVCDLDLAEEINKQAEKNDRNIDILIQVNVSGELNKQGVEPDSLENIIKELSKFNYINFKGLMTMAPFSDNPEDSRPYFKELRKLRDKISKDFEFKEELHLSMGMSGDYEVAVEEGATMVRVGTALFQ